MLDTVREIYREMRAKRWLAVAVIAEALGLVGAIGSIPAVGFLPLIWALAVVGILSTIGVLIVTAHYVWEYNRRPLNNTQRTEVGRLLSPYLLSEEAKSLTQRSELSDFVPKSELLQDFGLFWAWQYQKSVMDLAWTAHGSLGRPGYVLAAELTGFRPAVRIQFTLLPPPVENVGECQVVSGEEIPHLFSDWGGLFQESSPIVFFKDASKKIKYLRADQRMVFSNEVAAPILVSGTATNMLPELQKVPKAGGSYWGGDYEWVWATPQSAG